MRKRTIGPPSRTFPLDPAIWGDPRLFQMHPISPTLLLIEFNGGELAVLSLDSGNVLSNRDDRGLLTGDAGLDFSSNLSNKLLIRALGNWKSLVLAIPDLSLRFEVEAQHGNSAISAKISPCGRWLALGYGRYPLRAPDRPIDSVVEIWALRDDSLEFLAWQRMPGVACSAIAWSSDSQFLTVFSGGIDQQRGYLALIETTGWKMDQICESHRGIFRDAFIGRYSVMVLGSEGCELRWLVDLGDPDEVSFSEIETGPPRSKFGPGGFVFANRGMVSFEDEYMVVLPKGILGASSLEGGGIAAFDNDGHLHIWPAGTLSF